MKKLDNEKWMVIGRDGKPKGRCLVYYVESAIEAQTKSEELGSMGLKVRYGTVRNILGA